MSVSNKDGVEEFCQGLVDLGYTVLSTGGTAQVLKAAGVPVTNGLQVGEQIVVAGGSQLQEGMQVRPLQ